MAKWQLNVIDRLQLTKANLDYYKYDRIHSNVLKPNINTRY